MAVDKEADKRGQKTARTEFTKRGIELQRADVRTMHGIVYVRGTVTRAAGAHIADLRTEMEHIARLLRQKQGIKDVVLDCTVIG